MKRGFALLETIVVITFVAVSLLLLYGTFRGMVTRSKDNILYDNASDIYKAFYLKEYLELDKLNINGDINFYDCKDSNNTYCSFILDKFDVNKIYITKYDLKDIVNKLNGTIYLKDYDKSLYSSFFNNYVGSLSNKGDYKYRLIVEFNRENTYSYASLGMRDDHE